MDIEIKFPEFWPYQEGLIYAPQRFIYITGGRRSGKSRAAMFRQAMFAINNPETLNWTVERTHRHAKGWFRWTRLLFPPEAIRYSSWSDLRLELTNGAVWEFVSADRPDSLRGDGISSLVGHEAAFWTSGEYAWNTIRPALADKPGWVVLNSTPNGENWFSKEWIRAEGTQGQFDKWISSRLALRWPTSLSPLVDQDEIEDARRTIPDSMFRQEWLGEFVTSAGSLFHPHPKTWTGFFELPGPGMRYVAGFDLAKRRDWSAWIILRVDTLPWRVVDFGRMQQVDYLSQTEILAKKFKQYSVRLALSDAYQESVIEVLRAKKCNVEEFSLTATSRPTLLMDLALVLEKGEIVIPPSSEDKNRQFEIDNIRKELGNFVPKVSKTGSVRYEAAEGYNDDYVFALAMAVEAAKRALVSWSGGGFLAVANPGGRSGATIINDLPAGVRLK